MRIVVAVLAALAVAAPADAAPVLPVSHAKHAAMVYERSYWRFEQPAPTLSVVGCHRLKPRKVRCAVQASQPSRTLVSDDVVTLLAHGILRIHPVGFSLEAVLDE